MRDIYKKCIDRNAKREKWFEGIFVLGWLVPFFCMIAKHQEMMIISIFIWIGAFILGCILCW